MIKTFIKYILSSDLPYCKPGNICFAEMPQSQIRDVTCESYFPDTARSWQLDFFGGLYLNRLCL